jgi:hypothetical protein
MSFSDTSVSPVSAVRILGVIFDSNMSMSENM